MTATGAWFDDGIVTSKMWANGVRQIRERDGEGLVCEIPNPEWSRQVQNTRLLLAAPELLAAAKMIASFAVSWEPLTPGDIRELTDAIAKAEGRALAKASPSGSPSEGEGR